MTRNRLRTKTCLLSKIEPRIVNDALQDDDWSKAMEEEIEMIKNNKTWTLVSRLVDKIIGDKEAKPMTRSRLRSETCLLSKMEPRIVSEALQDDDWYNAMKEEIEQIEKNKTWTLVPRLVDKNVIGTKWVFRNKIDENGEITKNKARIVSKGYA